MDEHGRRRTRLAYTDKTSSQRLARRLEDDARARRDGLVDPAAERLRTHGQRPIGEQVSDYEQHLVGKGSTQRHVAATIGMICRAIQACGWTTIADIDALQLSGYQRRLTDAGRSPRTVNWHRAALRGFARWLTIEGRLRSDPLLRLGRLNEQTDLRRVRRALDDDELAILIDAAEHGPARFGLGGADRAMLYRVAVGTGFRVNELFSLTPRSFDLDADPPTVTVEAAYSKRRRRDVQPIRPGLGLAGSSLAEAEDVRRTDVVERSSLGGDDPGRSGGRWCAVR